MKLTKSIFMGTGAVVLAGSILTLVAPKAAHAIVATAVQVVNTTASPVPNKDVDQPARHAFTQYCSGSDGCTMTPPVPAGNVFVVQTENIQFSFSGGNPVNIALYGVTTNSFNTSIALPAVAVANDAGGFLADSNRTFYQDAGSTPLCQGVVVGSSYGLSCYASGYLVTVP